MKNLNHIFQFEPDYNPAQDNVMTYINDIRRKDLDFKSGFVFVPFDEIVKLNISDINIIFQDSKYHNWGVLQGERDLQFQELDRLIDELITFYTTRWNYESISENGFSPQQITYFLNKQLLRLKRMMCVLDSEYSTTQSKHSKTGKWYDMIKGYWYDGSGNKVRNVAKNIGNSEASFEEQTIKLLTNNVQDVITYAPQSINGYEPDLVVVSGKNKWVVEIKYEKKDDFIRTFVMFEMWKLYKKTYGI